MPEDFVPPTTSNGDPDLLEQLLVIAAEKAATREAESALKKGFVTREQLNAGLNAFGEQLQASIVQQITETLMPQVQESVQKAYGDNQRKSTVATPEDERDADPI